MQVPGLPERDRNNAEQSPAPSSRDQVPTGPIGFANADQMKDKIRQEMTAEPYDVAVFYHKTGFARWIATHPRFEQFTLFVISLNAIWIWVDTDFNPGPVLLQSPPLFQIVEHAFCFYFTYEWTMRFTAFKRKRNGLKDAWFVFDSLLVSTMVFETWVMTTIFLAMGGGAGGLGNASILRMARLLRLTRMARMARLLRAMPELLILIKGMVAALRSVAFTLSLLGLILFIFGILFRQLCEDSPCESMFPTVLTAMHVLLVNGALMDSLSFFVQPLEEQSVVLLIIFYVYLLLAALTVMNMLIGVICEVVSAVAVAERETLRLSFVREKIQELMTEGGADEDDDGLISKAEFHKLLGNKKATSLLDDVGVDVVGLVDFADAIFELTPDEIENGEEEKKLTFGDFMNVILDMRGDNTATFKDIVELRKNLDSRFTRLERLLDTNGLRTSTSRLLSTDSLPKPGLISTEPEKEADSNEDGLNRREASWLPMLLPTTKPWSGNAAKGEEVTNSDAAPVAFPDLCASARDLLVAHECRVTELRHRLSKLEVEAASRLASAKDIDRSSHKDRLLEPFSGGAMPVLADCGSRAPRNAAPSLLISAADQHQDSYCCVNLSHQQDKAGIPVAGQTNGTVAPETALREPSKTPSPRGDSTGAYSWSSMRRARQAMNGLTGDRSPRVPLAQLPRLGSDADGHSPRAV